MYRLFKIASTRKTNINLPPSRSALPRTLCNRDSSVSGKMSIMFFVIVSSL